LLQSGNSIVVDDFGDVFGIFLAVSGDGFTYPELRRYAEFLRRELLLVDNVEGTCRSRQSHHIFRDT
jgi:hypothetical protein